MNTRLILLGLLFLSLLVTPVNAASGDVLLFASGGYSSCKNSSPYQMSMYNNIYDFYKMVAKEVGKDKVRFIFACLSTDPPPNGDAAYATSKDPGKILYGNAYDLSYEIKSLANKDTAIFMIGHSYGGWLSMYLNHKLGNTYNMAGLFTLDPISPKTCGPFEVVFGGSGCHQAPKDLDTREIAKRTKVWLNFYQNQDNWINSSKIPDATNFHMQYRGAHVKIDNDERVWNKVKAAVANQLAD